MSDVFEVHEFGVNEIERIGELTLRSQRLHHNIDSYGLRIEAADGSMVYSGDTGPCQELIELARGADLLLCEVGSDELVEGVRTYHCAPEDAGQIAAAADVQHLMLTHIARNVEPQKALERAAKVFDGPISVALPGSTVLI
jgi:ribonuclease BN (tRNA processing enzyme)